MARARGASAPTTPKPRSDAYVGLLAIALLAQIIGAVFFFLDWNLYPSTKPPEVPKAGVAPAANPTQAPPKDGAAKDAPPKDAPPPPKDAPPPPKDKDKKMP